MKDAAITYTGNGSRHVNSWSKGRHPNRYSGRARPFAYRALGELDRLPKGECGGCAKVTLRRLCARNQNWNPFDRGIPSYLQSGG